LDVSVDTPPIAQPAQPAAVLFTVPPDNTSFSEILFQTSNSIK
jgi:hypothetical protein